MYLCHMLLLPLICLLPLVNSEACVVGGPANEVSDAKECCRAVYGTWYQFYSVLAICVMDDSLVDRYNGCVDEIPGLPKLDTRCIPGDGPRVEAVHY
jgi:hypothetical protein